MDGPREYHIKLEKDKYYTTYMYNQKNNTNGSIYKTDSHGKQTYGYQWGKGVEEGEINQEYGINRFKLL